MSIITIYIPDPLSANALIDLSAEHAHYLHSVMRQRPGEHLLLFNGQDGQWQGVIESLSKKNGLVRAVEQTRPQTTGPDIWLCFAPVKNSPINTLIQKATELGVSRLQPVITQHTIVPRTNSERLLKIAVEAAEQCERLTIPTIAEPVKLAELLKNWDASRGLILCDESGGGQPMAHALQEKKYTSHAILIGPEGGFSQTEFEILRNSPYIISVGMGPRILRADTAAMAALACYQSILGDWDEPPRFKSEG